MPEIIAVLRVKNESRWIGEVLASVMRLCPRLYIMDDHSTDDTAAIAENCGAVVLPSPFSDFNEARDKEWLLRQVAAAEEAFGFGASDEGTPWVLFIDGDEVLEPGSAEILRDGLRWGAQAPAYSIPVVYLWNRRGQARVDGVYRGMAEFGRPSLFRLSPEALTFMEGGGAGNLHCSNVPAALRPQCIAAPEGVRLLHLGYLDQQDRIRKYRQYAEQDGRNPHEDGYRHVVVGDIFPPSARFRHGGPLELVDLDQL